MKKMMKKAVSPFFKRILPCLLALVFVLGSAGCACSAALFTTVAEGVRGIISGAGPTPAQRTTRPEDGAAQRTAPLPAAPTPAASQSHPNIPFSEMAYERPDTEALADLLNDLLFDAEKGVDTDALLARYDEALARYNDADSRLSLCYVLYAHDVTDSYYQEEYAWLQAELTELDLAMTDVSLALLERGGEARERWGEAYVGAVEAGASLNSPEIQPLLDREQALTMEYDELLSSFVLQDGGRTYTMEQIGEIASRDYDEYIRLYDAYTAALNAGAGEIYLKLLAIRHEIAGKLGYGSYAAYMYDCFGRDYSVTDAQALHAAVKEHLVPVYGDAVLQQYFNSYAIEADTFALEPFLSTLRAAAADFSPLLLESLDYMLENGLYDFEANANKMESSFTTYFSNYDAPFMFTAWEDSFHNTATVIHELGHYTNYYHNASVGWSVADPLDLAEVDSQGLELLMIPYYASFYGSGAAAGAAELYRLTDAMYAVISGCMEDEFQQAVYADPGMTLEEMNALYLRLAQEYGFADLYGYTGTEWTMIPHTFQSPMYYISYAVSMIPALELWELSCADMDAARTAYFSILQREAYSPFRATIEANGLSDPLSPETVKRIAEVLERACGY